EVGTMANTNMPLLTFVPTGSLWVAADFREKSVANVDKTFHALVTFDANPGSVYDFDLASRDYGVAAAQQTPNGALTKVEVNNRWVRDAQRTRVNLTSSEELPPALFVGSRATIVLYPDNSIFWQLMAQAQIHLASWFHFIY
ncbi:HlyD family secretion protein, partial [Vibrio alginolyticus]